MTSIFKPDAPPPAPPPPPPLKPLEDLPSVEDAAGLGKKKMAAAKKGASQFIWLPTVGTPSE